MHPLVFFSSLKRFHRALKRSGGPRLWGSACKGRKALTRSLREIRAGMLLCRIRSRWFSKWILTGGPGAGLQRSNHPLFPGTEAELRGQGHRGPSSCPGAQALTAHVGFPRLPMRSAGPAGEANGVSANGLACGLSWSGWVFTEASWTGQLVRDPH